VVNSAFPVSYSLWNLCDLWNAAPSPRFQKKSARRRSIADDAPTIPGYKEYQKRPTIHLAVALRSGMAKNCHSWPASQIIPQHFSLTLLRIAIFIRPRQGIP
jgi:hypothetical protein